MIEPDDDFDDDFDDGDTVAEDTDTMEATAFKADQKHHDTRRKIEDILEMRRLREEFGELDF